MYDLQKNVLFLQFQRRIAMYNTALFRESFEAKMEVENTLLKLQQNASFVQLTIHLQ